MRARAFPLYSRALLLRIVSALAVVASAAAQASDAFALSFAFACIRTGFRSCCYRSFMPWHRADVLLSLLLLVAYQIANRSGPLRPWLLVVACSRSAYMSESMQRVLCRVRVHFYKNIYYCGYFMPKNGQDARYFALFSKNIW